MAGGGGLSKPMAWWGVIQSSVRDRATTAEVWQAIREFGAANDIKYPPGMLQEVNRMRSQAAGLRNASERLDRAASTDALTGSMLAPLPYARPGVERDLARSFHVRVGYTARKGSETDSSYITLSYSGQLPATVGELYADAQVATASTVDTYGGELIGLDAIEIGEW
jgi:hypothetical protein